MMSFDRSKWYTPSDPFIFVFETKMRDVYMINTCKDYQTTMMWSDTENFLVMHRDSLAIARQGKDSFRLLLVHTLKKEIFKNPRAVFSISFDKSGKITIIFSDDDVLSATKI